MSDDTVDDPPSDVALAKGLPALTLVAGLVLALGYVGVGKVVGLSRTAQAGAVSIGVAPLSVAMLYQSVFIWRNPQKSIEYDVKPPSKYDLSYDSTLGARLTSVLAAVAGVFGLVMAAFFARLAL